MTQESTPIKPDLTEVFADRPEQKMEIDLFLPPSGGEPKPMALFVHGGGWHGGSRAQFHWHARQLSSLGYVAASVSYRLGGVARYPAAIDDVQAGVRWLKKHAARFNGDPERLGAVGSSAGGHLVAMLATRDTLRDDVPGLDGISSRVCCAVDIHGVHDLLPWRGLEHNRIHAYIGGSPQEVPQAWREASPLFFVDEKTAPIMFTHAKDDPTVPYEQTVWMIAKMAEVGRPFAFVPTPGSGHGFVYNPSNPWTQKLWPDIVMWLDRYLKTPVGG